VQLLRHDFLAQEIASHLGEIHGIIFEYQRKQKINDIVDFSNQ
jgi:hypothetical protein